MSKHITRIITVYSDGSVDIASPAGTTPQTADGAETPPKPPPHP